nr:hypothetical protein [uncultured Shimia sp.]
MDNQPKQPLSVKIDGWLPYALPVLGGLLGVSYVNMVPQAFVNPVLAIVIGVVAGRILAFGIGKLLRPKR